MRKPEGVKPLDLHVPPIHINTPLSQPYTTYLGKLKEDLEGDEAVNISSITEFPISMV